MCRTSTQRIPTNTNVEDHLLLHYFNYTNSKLVLQKVKGQTVQGQTAQEFRLFSADPQCPLVEYEW